MAEVSAATASQYGRPASRHVAYRILGQEFIVQRGYQPVKGMGQGAYGIVCAAHRRIDDSQVEGVAIKKVTGVFSKRILAKRALREISLLAHFRGHKNITCLYDLDIVDPLNFNEVYLYEELMEADLHAIIRSGQPLTDAHFQSFVYQTLCALKYIHSANVLHRDVKPSNLLVNANCELKLCDFGLARGFSNDPQLNAGFLTEYVATRWYRAPEIMLSFQSYSEAIDVWSVGCVLAELLGRRPVFKGRDYVDQLNQILNVLGTPPEEAINQIGSKRAQDYIRSLPPKQKIPFSVMYPQANPDALDLLDKMLSFDPKTRISVDEALQHPYLAVWHDPSEEITCPTTFNFGFESVNSTHEIKELILDEVMRFRMQVRNMPIPNTAANLRGSTSGIGSGSEPAVGIPVEQDSNTSKGAGGAGYNYDDVMPKPHETHTGSVYDQANGTDADFDTAALENELADGIDAMKP